MSVNQLYHTWLGMIEQLVPQERITRLRIFVRFATGLYLSRSVHLSRIAGKIPGMAKRSSKVKRLRRFLKNPKVQVRRWYEPLARRLLGSMAARGAEIRLLIDGTRVGFDHQLLMVGVAYRRRALPVAWTWVKSTRGHSSVPKQLALLGYVRSLVPQGASVLIVGDSEFGDVPVLRKLQAWGWRFVLRQQGRFLIQPQGQPAWTRFDQILQRSGQRRWLQQAHLTAKYAFPVNLFAYWKPGEEQPWLLATNLPDPATTLRAYKRRMWIDEMFGDLKKHGFDLESTHLRHFSRLSRLTLVVAWVYYWLVCLGASTIKNSQRSLVDRPDRRDRSVFRIGFDVLERRLVNHLLISFRSLPYF